jgi:protein-disulfide isomerase
VANARLLEVTSTPTIFVNGRRIVGADAATIERFIQFELADKKAAAAKQ